MSQALAAVRASMTPDDTLTLYYGSHDDTVGLYCETDGHLKHDVREQLKASYPDLTFERITPNQWKAPAGVYELELHLIGDLLPIASLADFDDQLTRGRNDPVSGILNVVAGEKLDQFVRVRFDVQPAPRTRTLLSRRNADRYFGTALHRQARRGAWYLHGVSSTRRWQRVATRCVSFLCYRREAKPPKEVSPEVYRKGDSDRFLVRARIQVLAEGFQTTQRRAGELAAAFARYTSSCDAEFITQPPRKKSWGFLLSCDEMALLWHPPTESVRTERQQVTGSRELQPPPRLVTAKESDGVALGDVVYGKRHDEVALSLEDRRKHLYIIGQTGTGKSSLLKMLAYQDIQQRRGVGVLDPHGDLVDGLLPIYPRHRTNDLIYFNAAEATFGFNPLKCRDPNRLDLVATEIVSSLSKVFGLSPDSAPRLLHVLRNTVRTLMYQPDATLLDITPMLNDSSFRDQAVKRIKDKQVRSFWEDDFANWPDKYRQEALPAIHNKIGALLTSEMMRSIFAPSKRSLDLRDIMDKGQVLLVNASLGRLGTENTQLLLALLVSSLEQAALSRADIPEADRRDFYAYCDEFQNYAGTKSFEVILAQARKYRLCLTLAHQYGSQIEDEEIDKAVFGNVGTKVLMRVGYEDAERLSREVSFEKPPEVRPEDLIALPDYRAIVSLSVDGVGQRPLSMKTRPPVQASSRHAKVETLLKQTRRIAGIAA